MVSIKNTKAEMSWLFRNSMKYRMAAVQEARNEWEEVPTEKKMGTRLNMALNIIFKTLSLNDMGRHWRVLSREVV